MAICGNTAVTGHGNLYRLYSISGTSALLSQHTCACHWTAHILESLGRRQLYIHSQVRLYTGRAYGFLPAFSLLAAILGFFAALTRSAGLFLVIPFLYEVWVSRERIGASIRIILRKFPDFLLKAFPIILIPLGTLLYCLYNWILFGNPFAFASVQIYWARHLSWPWVGIWQALVDIFWATPFGSFYEVHTLIDLTATIGFIILAILGWRKLHTSYNLWLAILLLFMLLSPATTQHDALQSNQRFVLEMFPAFITLAALGIKHYRLHQVLLLVFPTLQAVLAMLFVLNRWMV